MDCNLIKQEEKQNMIFKKYSRNDQVNCWAGFYNNWVQRVRPFKMIRSGWDIEFLQYIDNFL